MEEATLRSFPTDFLTFAQHFAADETVLKFISEQKKLPDRLRFIHDAKLQTVEKANLVKRDYSPVSSFMRVSYAADIKVKKNRFG
jgi:hypothetical protein